MKNKQISGGIILSFLAQFIGIGVGLAYTPVMIRILGQNEFGLYQLVQSVVSYLTLMNLGFNGAYIRYYSMAKAKKDNKEVANINGMFFSIFMILAAAMLIGGTILYFNIGILGNHLTAADYVIAKKLLVILVINLSLSMPNSLFVAYIVANERFVYQKTLAIICNLLVPALNLPLLLLGKGSFGLVSVTLFLTCLQFAVNVYFCFKRLKMQVTFGYFNKALFADLMGFTFFIFLSDMVDQLNTNVDKLLLGRMSGTVSVAIYSVAFNLKTHYTTLTWLMPEMFVPEVNRIALEEHSEGRLTDIFIKMGRLNNYLVLLVITGFILCGRQFMHLWVGAEYDTSYYVAMILMVAGYIPAVQTLGVNIQNAKNMHQMRSYVYFGVACCNVVLSIFLIKLWGEIGTAMGTLLAILLGNGVFMNIYYHKKLGLNVLKFWKEMLKSVPFCAIVVGLGLIALRFYTIDSWLRLLLFAGSYAIVYCALLFALGLKKQERYAILRKLHLSK